jgi:drug/metabolite transporter superfamily protein YnfA
LFENRVLRRIFGTKRDEMTGEWRNYVMRSLMIYTPRPILFCDKIEKNEMGRAYNAYGGEERRIQGFGGET